MSGIYQKIVNWEGKVRNVCMTVSELEQAALQIKRDLLTLCFQKSIHIGGDLSVADVMTVLWQYQMKYDPLNIKDENRDRFILSKGHAAAVTSLNQAAIGCFKKEDFFEEYATNGGRFSMHSCKLVNPYVEVSTGSLGHGLPIASGIAAGLRRKGNHNSRVYVVMGDGEQSEGSVWEAAMNAIHYELGNLVAIVDCNGLEADGFVEELTGLNDIAKKYEAFGWNVVKFDGHNISQIKNAFDRLPPADSKKPTVFISKTIKGKGVSFMENNVNWHAGKMNEEQFAQAMKEINEKAGMQGGQ